MGTMNHNAVIATTCSDDKAMAIDEWIANLTIEDRALFCTCGSWTNGYTTFILSPDGSKEGWDESKDGDTLRDRFVDRLFKDDYDDGSSPWDWVEVGFGEFGQAIIRGNCRNRFNKFEYATLREK